MVGLPSPRHGMAANLRADRSPGQASHAGSVFDRRDGAPARSSWLARPSRGDDRRRTVREHGVAGARRGGLPVHRGPRAWGRVDRPGSGRVGTVPGGAAGHDRGSRRTPPVVGRHGWCRRPGGPRCDRRGAVREPRGRSHRRPGQLAAGPGDARRARHRVRCAVAVGGFGRRARDPAVGGRLCRLEPGPRAGPGRARDRFVARRTPVGRRRGRSCARLGAAAQLAGLPADELRARLDPRSIDIRSAALGEAGRADSPRSPGPSGIARGRLEPTRT